jgi:hypothetical protein
MYSTAQMEAIPVKYVYGRMHECPICANYLQMVESAIYVKRGTEEESEWPWSVMGRTIPILADGYFVFTEFFCPHCKFQTRMRDYYLVDPEKEPPMKPSSRYPQTSQHAIKYLTYVDYSYFYHGRGEIVKRRCPDCGKKMLSSYTYKIVEPDSPEAKDYDFTIAGKEIEGRIEFRKGFFICPRERCRKEITFDEMHEIENGKEHNFFPNRK